MNRKGILWILLTALIFSTMEIASKAVATSINPFQLTFLRFLIGGVTLLLLNLRHRPVLRKEDVPFFLLNGFLCVVLSMTLFQLALLFAKASTVAILISTNPIFTVPLAVWLLRERVDPKMPLYLLVALAGVGCILNPFQSGLEWRGALLATIAAITFSLFSVVSRTRVERYGPLLLNAYTFLAGAGLLLPLLLFFHIPVLAGTVAHAPVILYLGIVVTGLGYLTYFLAMQETSTVTASAIFFIKPALAPFLAFLLLGEAVPLQTLGGILFILLGSALMLQSKGFRLLPKHPDPA